MSADRDRISSRRRVERSSAEAAADDREADRVAQTLRALELFATRPGTNVDLAERLGVHPRTARRLMSRLEAEGYLSAADPQRRHTVTMKLVALAGRIVVRTALVQVAVPYVVQLRNLTDEASHLCVPREDGAMHLVQESGHNAVMVRSQVGEIAPYPSTAVGKALLAHMPEQLEVERKRLSAGTALSGESLVAELERIRACGWAGDDREHDPDLRCIAAPVFDHAGQIVGALGMSAPATRLHLDQFGDRGETVKEIADALSVALGHERRALSS
ncbi:MAG: IclR family transcriptional regulator [Solirubrobacteraceae bacterium]